MKSAITISLVPQARGGPFVYWNGLADGCAKAAALGFDAVERFPSSANTIGVAELTALTPRFGRLPFLGVFAPLREPFSPC